MEKLTDGRIVLTEDEMNNLQAEAYQEGAKLGQGNEPQDEEGVIRQKENQGKGEAQSRAAFLKGVFQKNK